LIRRALCGGVLWGAESEQQIDKRQRKIRTYGKSYHLVV
jgi:hypothetical protein